MSRRASLLQSPPRAGLLSGVFACASISRREAVQSEVETYTSSNFSDSVMSATYVKDGKVVVCISGAEFDARNMWR